MLEIIGAHREEGSEAVLNAMRTTTENMVRIFRRSLVWRAAME